MDSRCSIFANAFDDTSTNYVSVSSILRAIKSGRWKDQILKIRGTKEKALRDKLKSYVPGACFSGTFKKDMVYIPKTGKTVSKARMDNHVLEYTGIVIVDIDIKDQAVISRLKNMMIDDPYVYSFFASPSGGLKVLYVVNSTSDKHRDYAYDQIKSWVEDNYDIEVDTSGKNISRLCYVSYDPELYLNNEYILFEVDTTKKPEEVARYQGDFSNLNVETDINEVYRIAKGWMANKGDHYKVGARNDYIHKMTCILNRSGLNEQQILFAITSNHSVSQNTYTEVQNTIKAACNRNAHEFGTKPIRSSAKKKSNDLTNFM